MTILFLICLTSRLLFWGDVIRRRRGAFSEEILLHLADDDFLIFAARGVHAVFVEQHLAEFSPLVPGLLRDVVINLVAEVGVKRGLVQAGKFLMEFDAINETLCHKLLEKIIS